MTAPSKMRALGSDHREAGRVALYPATDGIAPQAALSISPGLRKTANEDVGGWERYERRSFYAVADAHFGAASAVLAIESCLTILPSRFTRKEHFEPERFRRSFAQVCERTEAQLQEAESSGRSATTLLVLALGGGRLFWGSFGDSRLYLAADGVSRQVNRITDCFLSGEGRSASALSTLMVCGEIRSPGAGRDTLRLMLSTDGLPQARGTAAEEWDPAAIGSLLSAAPDVANAAKDLTNAALLRGGADNVCAIVIELPSGFTRP